MVFGLIGSVLGGVGTINKPGDKCSAPGRSQLIVLNKKGKEALNLGKGGSNFKRFNAYGWEARMSHWNGRQVIERRKKKGRWDLCPGSHVRNKRPSDNFTFYPEEGKGFKRNCINDLKTNGFKYRKPKKGFEQTQFIEPEKGWDNYLGEMKLLICVKHGIAPIWDDYMGTYVYVEKAAPDAAQKVEAEFAELKQRIEYEDQQEYYATM